MVEATLGINGALKARVGQMGADVMCQLGRAFGRVLNFIQRWVKPTKVINRGWRRVCGQHMAAPTLKMRGDDQDCPWGGALGHQRMKHRAGLAGLDCQRRRSVGDKNGRHRAHLISVLDVGFVTMQL